MSNMNIRYGQPVQKAGMRDVLLVVGQDSSDPAIYYGIPEKQVNTHVRVDLVPFTVDEVKPLKAYAARVGEMTTYNGEPARIVSTANIHSGVVMVKTACKEAFACRVEETTLGADAECREIKVCAGCGGYIDAGGEDPDCITRSASRKPFRIQASVNPEVEKSTKKAAVVSALNTLLAKLSFANFAEPEKGPAPLEESEETPTLEFGERVFKPAANTVAGTIIGKTAACHIVAWDNSASPEPCWGFELKAVRESISAPEHKTSASREINLDE